MKNTIGTSVSVTIFGESHGVGLGAVLDGIAPGIPVDEAEIARRMARRRGAEALSTARREPDSVRLISGAYNGYTTGTPLTFLIENQEQRSGDYAALANTPRPGHADYTAACKYHGFADMRGGGHFSGRLTAGLVAAGTVALRALANRGIRVGTRIAAIGGIADRPIGDIEADLALLAERDLAALDTACAQKMQAAILAAREEGDSLGGVLETYVLGLPAGVGEPWFDTVEGVLAHWIFSVPAVKAVEFGDGLALSAMRGSEANDAFLYEAGQVVSPTNHAGGVLGGITSGMPLCIRTAIKPTPSIYKEQRTVNLETKKDERITIKGRHDPCIAHRAPVVLESVVALALCDLLATRYGTDYLANAKK